MNEEYWQPQIETMPRKELEQLQLKKTEADYKHCAKLKDV